MLIWEYLLPGSIILLKFFLRLTTDQQTNWVDTLKAIMVFPVDIAFLSLSYGAAILYTLEVNTPNSIPVKASLTAAFAAITFLILVIVVSKKSENALVLAKTKTASALAALGYALAFLITASSVSIGGII